MAKIKRSGDPEGSAGGMIREEPRGIFNGEFQLGMGRVVSYHGGFNFYTVALGDTGMTVAATLSGQGGGSLGSRSSSQIVAGSYVIVAYRSGQSRVSDYAVILGVVRVPVGNDSIVPSDLDVYVPGAGVVWDEIHNYLPISYPDRIGLQNFSDGSPSDSLAGEWGVYNPLGPAVHLGYFMAMLRASDRCGLWVFKIDELTRLSGKSLEISSYMREVRDLYDEGELNHLEEIALYPWEALGAFSEQALAESDDSNQTDPESPPENAPVHTKEQDQRPIMRYRSLVGYMGDLAQRFVAVPVDGSGIDRYSNESSNMQSLFREVIGTDGSYRITSAKGLCFEKWSLIPFPSEKRLPNDPEGDNRQNYKSSGKYGQGEEHQRQDFDLEQPDARAQALTSLERHGHFNLQSFKNISAHEKDWEVGEESNLPLGSDLEAGIYPGYSLDPKKQFMPLPKAVDVQVDHRFTTKIYASRSVIEQFDDGSILLEDGYGSQIFMGGGNIWISCPNDLFLAPGRSLVAMAPQDAVIRAGNSLDLTATRKDVRIKAERNLMALGGNSGEGGVLIESRDQGGEFSYERPGESSDIRGLVLKNAEGTIASYSKNLSLSTDDDGKTLIRALGEMNILAEVAHMEFQTSWSVAVGDRAGDLGQDADSLTRLSLTENQFVLSGELSNCVIKSDVLIDGGISWSEAAYGRGSLSIDGGGSFTGTLSDASGGEVSRISSQQSSSISQTLANSFDNGEADSQDETAKQSIEDTRSDLRSDITSSSSYFNVIDFEEKVSFSLRVEDDYLTEDEDSFLMFKFRWQEYAEDSGGRLWEENAVLFKPSGRDTLPWPGDSPWRSEQRLIVIESDGYFRSPLGVSSDRDQAVAPSIGKEVPEQSYIVNINI